MKLDDERLFKYLDQIAAETIDIEKTIGQIGKKKNSFTKDPHIRPKFCSVCAQNAPVAPSIEP